jgi:Mg-chelatase subunit ChlD
MNNDENNLGSQDPAAADREARIVAWVLGEASPAEAAELAALVAATPELAAFKAQLEEGRKLVAEAAAADPTPLRLPEGRRAGLLRQLAVTAKRAPASQAGGGDALVVLRRRHERARRWMLGVAACLAAGIFLTAVVPSYQKVLEPRAEYQQAKSSASEAPRQPLVAMESPAAEDTVAEKAPTAVLNNARQLPAASPEYFTQTPEAVVRYYGALKKDGAAEPRREAALRRDPVSHEDPIVLSPFTVDAAQDNHYRANSTLAGTRVRTDLKDVSKGVSIVTQQFLQDTEARDSNGNVINPVAGEPDADAVANSNVGRPYVTSVDDAKGFASGGMLAVPSSSLVAMDKIGPALAGKPTIVFGTGATGPILAPATNGDTETSAAQDPVSTFSLHVSDVSFRLAREALLRGELPDPAQVRPEEFYNAVDYGDPAPAMAEQIACRTEQAAEPFVQQRNLLRIAMRVPTTGRSAAQPLRLTVLLDTSGSMVREDRTASVRSAMKVLVSLLGPADRITLVGFARRPQLLADQVPGDQAGRLLDIIARTPPDGGTNLEAAIKLGAELAARQFSAGAQNRIVLMTDGAANLGDADPAHLAALIETARGSGVAFDACGVGASGIDDTILEALTRKGSGRYYVLNSPDDADEGFALQLAGAFRPAAENVKVQVRFNPARVGHYRLIGFEHHRLKQEDFRNDGVAAAALAAGEAAVALYEVEALPQGDGELGQVYVRFHDTASNRMVERSWDLPYEASVPAFDRASPTLQLAGTSALLAEKLRGGPRADAIRLDELAPVVSRLRHTYPHQVPVQELGSMYDELRKLRNE